MTLAEIVCLECGALFAHDNPWRATCGPRCRLTRRARQDRERERARVRGPEETLRVRARCTAWSRAHRACKRTNPWLAGPPPFGPHLPGFAQSIAIQPLPRWPIALRNTRALHGALTAILGAGHRARFPNFSIFPTSSGWGVHWVRNAAHGLPFEISAPLFDVPTRFRFGPRVRFRAPAVSRRGRARVTIEALTPVVIVSSGRTVMHTRPTKESILSAIGTEFPNRLTEDLGWRDDLRGQWARWVRDRAQVVLVDAATEPAHVPLGGKYGTVAGWTGSVTLEVNATGRWLLGAAERIGLGSRVGFGFGCIRVRDV